MSPPPEYRRLRLATIEVGQTKTGRAPMSKPLLLAALLIVAVPAIGQDLIGGDAPVGPPGIGVEPLVDPISESFVQPANNGGGSGGSVTYATP